MAKRSLYASKEGAKLARKIFDRRGWTQENLAAELDLRTRQPIWRFFTCRPIERHIFMEICTILDLNWWEIADQPPEPLLGSDKTSERSVGTDHLVEQIRLKHQDRIEHQCGKLRVLGTSCPVTLDDLYVPPRLLGRLASQEYLNLSELKTNQLNTLSNLREQWLGDSITSLCQVLESQSKLTILGKPGSGKTTLLKWTALQCNRGHFRTDLIPVLINLGTYVGLSPQRNEFTLLHCIQQELISSGAADIQTIETLLSEGRFLLLLDELDEISSPDNHINAILKEISRFCERHHKNRVIVTSRLASLNFEFPYFTDFELVDFNDEQLAVLAQKWFSIFAKSSQPEGSRKADELLRQLNASENQSIRELAGVPLFFNRVCQTFQGKGNLSENRVQIYQQCLTLLLSEWDQKRGIQRNNLWLQTKLSNQFYILSTIAASVHQKGYYFFERSDLEQYIEAGIRELQEIEGLEPQRLEPQNGTVAEIALLLLQQGLLLEQAHGLISFSQMAFQKYLIARRSVQSSNLEKTFKELLSHLTEPSWREVLLLVSLSSKLPDRNLLLCQMEQEIQVLAARNPLIELLLALSQQKSCKWLLYCQVAKVHTLLCQVVRTPELISRFAMYIVYVMCVCKLAQNLLLGVILAKVSVYSTITNQWSTQILLTVQPLLDQAIVLASNIGSHNLRNHLLDLRKQILRADWEGANFDQWQWDEIGEEDFWKSYIQSLRSYFYAVELFSDCQGKGESNDKVSSEIVPQLKLEMDTLDTFLSNSLLLILHQDTCEQADLGGESLAKLAELPQATDSLPFKKRLNLDGRYSVQSCQQEPLCSA